MKRHSLIRWSIPALLVAAALLNGCSWFHRDRVEYYKGAAETRPLEVPPDLDTPSSSKELVVPGTGGSTAPAAATSAGTSAAAAGASSAAMGATELHVADTVANTWQRVGIALERAQLGKVSSRDEATHSYTLDFDGAVASQETAMQPEHHWYTRILHPFGGDSSSDTKAQKVTVGLRVSVGEDAGGARVSVNGNPIDKSAPDAARRVIEVLRERLS